ncbi:MAG: amidohydrolase family protein [Gemmatimonadetes bacterium]|nr:amidohydrolase family protein [Gemmatimonadota bacterium]
MIRRRIGRAGAGMVLTAAFALAAPVAAQDIAIRNATVITIANGTMENATVVIRDGKIAAVGRDVQIPSGIRVIDGTGRYVMPGIIDAHSHMAIEGGINEGSESVTPEVIIPVRDDDQTIYRALAGGVTSALLLHGSANTIGGQGAVIKMRWGQPADSLHFEGAHRIVKFALGENVTRASSSAPDSLRRFPKSRMGVEQTLRWWFTQAQEYAAEWQAYDARRDRNAVPPRRDLRLEALADILSGEIKVHAHSYRGDEILMLMRVAEDFGFRINTFQHVLEGYKVADEMAAHGAMASTFADNWGYKVEANDAIPHNMAIMADRGIVVSVNSDSGERVRRMYQEAAIGMKYGGMSENEALKMITLNPAMQLGVDNLVGTIEVGKQADIAIFSAHPFAPETHVEMTLVDGKVYFDRNEAMTLRKLIDGARSITTTEDDR